MPREPTIHSFRPAIVAPLLVISAAIVFSCTVTPWALLAIPFGYLASVCALPNLNLADGCLAYLSILLGFVITAFSREAGISIVFGTMASYYLSAAEKHLTAKPRE